MSDAHDSPALSTRANRCHFPPIDTHLLRSQHVAQIFQIKVMQPLQCKESATRFPVLYLTDGNALFDLASGITALMQAFRAESSRFILVAVGYPGESPIAGEALRGRDLTFPGCPDFVRGHSLLAEWDGVLLPAAGTADFGGAAEFQRFLGEELIPYIDDRYPTVPHMRAYFGHSIGGSFGLFTLFTQPRLFQHYIVSSPAVSYHGRTPAGVCYEDHDFLLDRAREFISAGHSLEGARLYMSVGTEEENEPLIANWRFTSSFYRMVALLKGSSISGLELTAEALSGESHATACPVAFSRGVRAVLDRTWRPTNERER